MDARLIESSDGIVRYSNLNKPAKRKAKMTLIESDRDYVFGSSFGSSMSAAMKNLEIFQAEFAESCLNN